MKCDTCKMKRVCDELERMGKVPKHENCRCYTPEKPITNYDRLRAKSVEGMAEFMKSNGASCPDGHFVGDYDCKDCKDCWIDWLKKEGNP